MPDQYLLSKSNHHVQVQCCLSYSCSFLFSHPRVIQIKYLLVLAEKPKPVVRRRIDKNVLVIIVFVLMLAFVAFLRSPSWKRLRNKWLGS